MRKRIINSVKKQNEYPAQDWLDIEKLAFVEVSSENDAYLIECALLPDNDSEWRASSPGKQVIRLLFDKPQNLQWIRLSFKELTIERTQEYVLRWSPDNGDCTQEIICQQWNFSPEGSNSQVENHQVELTAVTILELSINPNINKDNVFASLEALQLA